MKYKILTVIFFILLMVNYGETAVPYFGADWLQGLSENQIKDLSEGKIIFNTSDSVRDEAIQSKSSIITAVMVLDKSPGEIYNILFQTEDQINILKKLRKS